MQGGKPGPKQAWLKRYTSNDEQAIVSNLAKGVLRDIDFEISKAPARLIQAVGLADDDDSGDGDGQGPTVEIISGGDGVDQAPDGEAEDGEDDEDEEDEDDEDEDDEDDGDD